MRMLDGDNPFKMPGSDSPLKSKAVSIQKAHQLQPLFMVRSRNLRKSTTSIVTKLFI